MIKSIILSAILTLFLITSYGRVNWWNKDLFNNSAFTNSNNIGYNNVSKELLRRKPKRNRKAKRSVKRVHKKRRGSNHYRSSRLSNPRALSHIDHHTNVYGQTVQAPTHYSSRPPGATALCRDGTYSFSQSRRGTCSGHGGVAVWF